MTLSQEPYVLFTVLGAVLVTVAYMASFGSSQCSAPCEVTVGLLSWNGGNGATRIRRLNFSRIVGFLAVTTRKHCINLSTCPQRTSEVRDVITVV